MLPVIAEDIETTSVDFYSLFYFHQAWWEESNLQNGRLWPSSGSWSLAAEENIRISVSVDENSCKM